MPLDSKIEFYLSHRELIEEWASIRERAAAATDAALRDAFTQFAADYRGDDRLNFGENGNWRWAQIHPDEPGTGGLGVHFELLWHQGHLFSWNHKHTWPTFGLMMSNRTHGSPKAPIREATQVQVGELQTRLASPPISDDRWVWRYELMFEPDSEDVVSFGRNCVRELATARSSCEPALLAISPFIR